jgi:hypothetical protein
MAQIMFPKEEARVDKGRKGSAGFGQQAGAALGAVAGFAGGGPIGAVKGAATGASIGGTLGGLADPGRAASISQPGQTQGLQANTGAVDRRLNEIQQNPHFQLQQAKAALPQLDPELQKEFAPTIEAALAASRKAQQVGRQS